MNDKYEEFVKKVEELSKEMLVMCDVSTRQIRTRDDFFNTNEGIFDSGDYWEEGVEVDRMKWLLHDYELLTDFEIDEVPWLYKDVAYILDDKIEELIEEGMLVEDFDLSSLTLDDIKNSPALGEYYDEVIEWIDYDLKSCLNFFEVESSLKTSFGIQDTDNAFNEIAAMAYWTIYFKPDVEDEDVAWRVGLLPFKFNDTFYLALGGCGMDLSPRLDAYQALVSGTLPRNTRFIDDQGYAKYVVGEKTYNEVMEAVKCEPVITITTW